METMNATVQDPKLPEAGEIASDEIKVGANDDRYIVLYNNNLDSCFDLPDGRKVIINGSYHAEKGVLVARPLGKGVYGKTYVDAELWEAVLEEYFKKRGLKKFTNGQIQWTKEERSAAAMAKDGAEVRHGFEPYGNQNLKTKLGNPDAE